MSLKTKARRAAPWTYSPDQLQPSWKNCRPLPCSIESTDTLSLMMCIIQDALRLFWPGCNMIVTRNQHKRIHETFEPCYRTRTSSCQKKFSLCYWTFLNWIPQGNLQYNTVMIRARELDLTDKLQCNIFTWHICFHWTVYFEGMFISTRDSVMK